MIKIITNKEALREKSRPVTDFGTETMLTRNRLYLAIKNHPSAVGVSAIQIGEPKRMFYLRTGGTFINPEIIKSGAPETATEGCLSCPGIELKVTRPSWIMVKYQNMKGEEITVSAEGLGARIIQHEMDHLDGKLITDYKEEKNEM